MERLQFIDKTREGNRLHGIEYFATGLILDSNMADGTPTASGKDYLVGFIDPFGDVHCEWRSHDEIEVSAISDSDYQFLIVLLDPK